MRNFLLAFIFLICFSLLGQNTSSQLYLPDSNYVVTKSKQRNNKLYSDTLWSEDFAGGLPSGWTIVNNSLNNFDWQWDTIYRPGLFSMNISAINSTSRSNGFMLLPMDFFNTPITTVVYADTYFQSPAIPINPRVSVELRAQQFTRFCCSNTNRTVVQVSTDNFTTFDEYPMNKYAVNQISPNVEFFKLNISKTLAGEDTAYLRFYAEGSSHYFWMIDDLALVEGNGQQIEEVSFYKPSLSKGPFPLISPANYLNDIGFEATVKNSTGDTITGVNLGVEVNHVKYGNGSIGAGLVYATNQLANNGGVINMQERDTIRTIASPSYFSPLLMGEYEVDFFANSIEYPTRDSVKINLTVSDTVFGRDFNSPTRKFGVHGYITYIPINGDRMGSLYYLDSIASDVKFSSISYYVSNDPLNIGAVIRPVIWEYNSDTVFATGVVSSGFGREVASSVNSYTITASDTNRWISLKLDTGIAMNRATNVGEFVVGSEQVGGASTFSLFTVGNDTSAVSQSPIVSHFIYQAHAPAPSWFWVQGAPMIRLNVKPLLVGINQLNAVESNITISPNPSNGIYKIQGEIEIETLQVFDINGKHIQNKFNSSNSTLDFSSEPSGIYFVRILEKSGEWVSEKLMKL